MYRRFGKRALDIFFAILLLIPVSLVVGICALPVYLEDRQSPLYISDRVGPGGRVFRMIKLRTMKVNAPDIRNRDGTTYSGADDPRMTRTGKFLRESSLDELPQLYNVLAGQMSFIGPRPALPDQQAGFTARQLHVNDVRPGITGYNQAYFRLASDMTQRTEHDLYYVAHISLWMDIKILCKTVQTVLGRKNVYTPPDRKIQTEEPK